MDDNVVRNSMMGEVLMVWSCLILIKRVLHSSWQCFWRFTYHSITINNNIFNTPTLQYQKKDPH